ncbi:MAG: hypothetical protein IPK19_32335 [Chloroflexi bacterium]|nr:hypothetical protein [Chloroflexota bacterium]
MDLLATLDPNSILLAVGIGCLCCVLAIVLGFGLQIVGVGIELIGNIFEVVLGAFGAGPVPGCGCIAIVGGCGLILGFAYLLVSAIVSCDTNPTNFCTLIGR